MRSNKAQRRLGRTVRAIVEPLENRRLLSAGPATASQSLMAFSTIASGNTGSGASPAQVLTVTNSGDSTLNISSINVVNDPAVATQDAGDFAVTNLAFSNSIAPGQSASFSIRFSAQSSGLHSAFLQIQSDAASDPNLQIALRGLGTTGTGGANEPSLAAILREYEIPTIVGDGPNDANAFGSTFYPATPDPSSQEVVMPRLVKAGNGPVTISTLAVFAVTNQPALRFGTYVPGDLSDTTQLFTINQSDSQTVHPTAQGATSFDPGSSEFGLYANFPTFTDNGHQRMSYSEDVLNPWDTNVPRKVRFFPLENADGSVVPNAYVFACEDNNVPFGNIQPYDSNDLVGIIYNVKPAADGAVLGLQNLSGVPSTTRLVFNRIQNPNPQNPSTFKDIVHDQNTLEIQNTGDQPLVITSLNLSGSNWQLVNPPSLPATVAVGASINVTVKFVATSDPPHSGNQINDTSTANGVSVNAAGGVANGTLTILSNDPMRPTRMIQLAGFWQYMSENENEPGLNTITRLMFGYGTTIGGTTPDLPNNGTTPVYYGEEVPSAYWNVADSTLPVSVRQLAVYHSQFDSTTGNETAASIGWYPKGTTNVRWLFQDEPGESQSVLPTVNGSTTTPAFATFSTTATFGWNLDGENSLDSANTTDISLGRSGHAVRFYPARDGAGNLIPNTWLVVMDYQGSTFENSDFQDNIYLVSNMRPATQAPAPAGAQATASASGNLLQWQPVSDSSLTGYNVYRSTSITGTYTKLNSTPITGISYLDTTAPAGTTSYYRITAVDPTGESEGTNAAILAVPAVPSNLSATPSSSTQINLTWSASATANSYDILRQGPADSGFVLIASSVMGTSFTDSNLSGASTYNYEIRANNSSGGSSYSAPASATTPLGGTPVAPSNLSATAASSTQINLAWNDNSNNESGFLIERSTDGVNFSQIGTTAGNVTSYSDSGLAPGTSYTYRVRATNSAGNSLYSAIASATTFALPAAPSNLLASAVSQTQINLSWTDNAGGSAGFILFRATSSDNFVQIATVAAGVTSYADTGLTASTTYSYKVLASNANGQPDYSNIASATTPAPIVTPPPPFDVTLGTGGAKAIQFTDADGTVGLLKWKGPGSAIVHFTGSNLSESSLRGMVTVSGIAALADIHAVSTTLASSLTVQTHRGNNSIDIGGFIDDAAFGRLIAPTANLSGDLHIGGSLNSIATGSMTGLSAIFGGTLVSLRTRRTADTTLSGNAMRSINLGSVASTRDSVAVSLSAHSISTLAGAVGAKRFSLHRLIAPADAQALLATKGIANSQITIELD